MGAKNRKKAAKQKESGKIQRKSKTILRRKLERQEKKFAKKQKKKQFYLEKFAKESQHQQQEQHQWKKPADRQPVTKEEVNQRTQKQLKELVKQQKEQRKKQLLLANELEARNIKQLEKQLGLARRKSKKLPKSFQEDGLDYVITACDSAQLAAADDTGSGEEYDEGARDIDDLEAMMQSDEDQGSGDEEFMSDDGDDDVDDGDADDDLHVESNDDPLEGEEDSDEEETGIDNVSESTTVTEGGDESSETWEDIYGRTRAKDGRILAGGAESAAAARYVPPALRHQSALQPDEKKRKELERLKKQVKGLLNRLAESNMHSIAAQLETFYRQNSRNDMNQTITDLIVQAVVQDVLTPERLVMEHIMLVAILHANVGTEVGAHVLQELVKLFNTNYSATDLVKEERKILDNLVLLLAYVHSFRIVGSQLIFGLLGRLADSFQPKDLELMLVMLKNAGFSLRKDDPAEMKIFITKVQTMASSRSGSPGLEDSRVKFMLDILLAVKNNNVNKIPNYDPSHFEHLKKTLKGYLREGNYVTELKLSLSDLEQADTRGRWWIVGSAFTGALGGNRPEHSTEAVGASAQQQQYSAQLLKLAKKLRMNTEARRNIFCLVLSSEDYLEAAERIMKLGTKNQLERDAVFVLTDCALQEKSFNPFYSQVAAKLAAMDRKYKIAAQFTIWDKIRLTADMKETQLTNLAKFISHLIREKTQSVGVLRIVEFAEMTKANVRLLRIILCEILLLKDEEEVQQIFQAVSEPQNLSIFREGIKLFFYHFLLKQKSKLEPSVDFELLQRRVKLAERALSVTSSKLRL